LTASTQLRWTLRTWLRCARSGSLWIGIGLAVARLAWWTGDQRAWSLLNIAGLFAGGIMTAVGLGTLIRGFQRWGACPECSRLSVGARGYHQCPGCERYLEVQKGHWVGVDDATVALAPTFLSAVPAHFRWPDGCVVCGGPPTRTERVTITVVPGREMLAKGIFLAGGWLRIGGHKSYALEVPHCASHDHGAVLDDPDVGPIRIRFRSHGYARRFRLLNRVLARWESPPVQDDEAK
jgi:hypothetical protein